MATSSSSAMKSSLVVVLLLSAVVASQAHRVSWTNTCKCPIGINGIWIAPAKTISMKMKSVVVAEVIDLKGVKHVGKYKCPEEVKDDKHVGKSNCLKDFKALVIVCVGEFVEVRIAEISGLGLSTEVGTEANGESPLIGNLLLHIPLFDSLTGDLQGDLPIVDKIL